MSKELIGYLMPDENVLTGAITSEQSLSGTLAQPYGSGTDDYNALQNKPSINGVELVGDLSAEDLDLITAEDLNTKVDKIAGYGLSQNDFTNADKNKLDGIESGAQENVIESVIVNGTALPVQNKSVEITVPPATPEATDAVSGTVKTNSADGISLNDNGQLEVQGRLGQMEETTGIFTPKTIDPEAVGNGSMLVTEASGTTLGNKSLSVTTGMNITLKRSHTAGSTTYYVTNSYINRIVCALAVGGVACLNESAADNTVPVESVTVDNNPVAPSSTNSTTDIIIKTTGSANPTTATTSIRVYPDQSGFTNLLFGVSGTAQGENGYSIAGGQRIFNQSNASAVFGNTQYNKGNSSLLAGRQHINTMTNATLLGMGHDSSNGSTEVTAVGKWSDITTSTLFAVGNGTSNTARLNAFEVSSDGSLILRDSNGTRWKISVTTSGTLSVIRA